MKATIEYIQRDKHTLVVSSSSKDHIGRIAADILSIVPEEGVDDLQLGTDSFTIVGKSECITQAIQLIKKIQNKIVIMTTSKQLGTNNN